jgi:hypothetical protein
MPKGKKMNISKVKIPKVNRNKSKVNNPLKKIKSIKIPRGGKKRNASKNAKKNAAPKNASKNGSMQLQDTADEEED